MMTLKRCFFPIAWVSFGAALLSKGEKLQTPECAEVNISYVGCPHGLTNQCFEDYECQSNMRCCANSCGRRLCVDTTEKRKTLTTSTRRGVCPQPSSENLCDKGESHQCVVDTDCATPAKCCSDGCTRVCFEPDIEEPELDRNTPKGGACPFVFGSDICTPDAAQESECAYDSDCMGDEKCCSDSCKAMKCVEVEPITLFSPSEEEEAKGKEEVEAGKRAAISCNKEYMDVAVKRDAFDKFGVSKLTLTDSSCLATSNETHYLIRAPLVGCGTLSRHNSDSVVYSNAVINRIGESMVTRAQEFQMPFSCFYTKEGVTSTNGLIPRKIITAFDGGNATTSFLLEMSLFKSASYRRPYGPKDFPLQVVLNKPVFIQVAVESPDTRLAVRAHQCYATPTEDPSSLVRYIIIDDGCSRDRTVRFYPTSLPHIQRFSFKAFKFIDQGQSFVYLHCRLVVCNASNPLSDCARSCDDESGLGRIKRSAVAVPARSLTEGPVMVISSQKALRRDEQEKTGINISMWVMIGMGTLCLICLAGVFYMKRRMSRGAQRREEEVPESRV